MKNASLLLLAATNGFTVAGSSDPVCRNSYILASTYFIGFRLTLAPRDVVSCSSSSLSVPRASLFFRMDRARESPSSGQPPPRLLPFLPTSDNLNNKRFPVFFLIWSLRIYVLVYFVTEQYVVVDDPRCYPPRRSLLLLRPLLQNISVFIPRN